MNAVTIDLSFAHEWQAEILAARPAILPARHYVYPREAEEIERGALEVMVLPAVAGLPTAAGRPSLREITSESEAAGPFLATCALGFRDPAVPTGIWTAPNAREICCVCGGYAYVIDSAAPERFTMIAYRPVLSVLAATEDGLLLFVGHRAMVAWGREGQAWETEKLSDEGVTIVGIEGGVLRGMGWEMRTDREMAFAIDLRTGQRVAPARP